MSYDLPLRDRLRIHAGTAPDLHCQLMLKAADEIERLNILVAAVTADRQRLEQLTMEGR